MFRIRQIRAYRTPWNQRKPLEILLSRSVVSTPSKTKAEQSSLSNSDPTNNLLYFSLSNREWMLIRAPTTWVRMHMWLQRSFWSLSWTIRGPKNNTFSRCSTSTWRRRTILSLPKTEVFPNPPTPNPISAFHWQFLSSNRTTSLLLSVTQSWLPKTSLLSSLTLLRGSKTFSSHRSKADLLSREELVTFFRVSFMGRKNWKTLCLRSSTQDPSNSRL